VLPISKKIALVGFCTDPFSDCREHGSREPFRAEEEIVSSTLRRAE
jgi:hypothetical protein